MDISLCRPQFSTMGASIYVKVEHSFINMIAVLEDSAIKKDLGILNACWKNKEPFILWNSNTKTDNSLFEGIDLKKDGFSSNVFLIYLWFNRDAKLIVASKDRAVGICEKIYAQLLYQCQDIVVSLPLTYSFAFINQFVYSGLSSKSLIVSNGISKPNEYLKITKFKGFNARLVGSQFNILKKYIGSLVFPNVRIINFAGGKFPQQEVEVIERMFPNAQIFNNYGCTEAVPRLTVTNAKETSSIMT